jgi:hypothetical protein
MYNRGAFSLKLRRSCDATQSGYTSISRVRQVAQVFKCHVTRLLARGCTSGPSVLLVQARSDNQASGSNSGSKLGGSNSPASSRDTHFCGGTFSTTYIGSSIYRRCRTSSYCRWLACIICRSRTCHFEHGDWSQERMRGPRSYHTNGHVVGGRSQIRHHTYIFLRFIPSDIEAWV